MKFITEPKVYLVGKQKVCEEELDRFLADEGVSGWETDTCVGAEKLVEVAGRLCYMSYAKPRPGGNQAYINHILEVQHGSVAEHAEWNFIFTGISRSLTHELIRHRPNNYSQLSQRYVDESDTDFVIPDALQLEVELAGYMNDVLVGRRWPLWPLQNEELGRAIIQALPQDHLCKNWLAMDVLLAADAGSAWLSSMESSAKTYQDLVSYLESKFQHIENKTERRKSARQAARSVLPNATETKIFVTANARSLRHMIEMRASRHADTEIRKLFCKVWEIMVQEAPSIFGDYEKVSLEDSTYELVTKNRKV
jgi:thymidylate synthase (FAD)